MEKPRVTEIQVRMDCNGCVQKIKKALHGINGIYDLYIDYPHQKVIVVGWADPEKIMKAIKKTRKVATLCLHTEIEPPAQPTEPPAPEGAPPAADATNPPPESPPAESAPPTEPPKDPPPPENPPPEVTPSPAATETTPNNPPHPSGPKDVEEIHVIHHHQPEYGYGYNSSWNHHPQNSQGGYWNSYANSHGFRPESPAQVSHSYNTYRPSPYITDYEYGRPAPVQNHYSRMEPYSEEYQYRGNGDGNNITSMFSDENPNACTIV